MAGETDNNGGIGKGVRLGVFWDSMTSQLNSKSFLDKDKKETAAAKKVILGRWTDGVLTFSIEPNNKLQWSCADNQHWLNRRGDPAPDWWNYSSLWELHLMCNMNTPSACGTHVSVLHIDKQELHPLKHFHLLFLRWLQSMLQNLPVFGLRYRVRATDGIKQTEKTMNKTRFRNFCMNWIIADNVARFKIVTSHGKLLF